MHNSPKSLDVTVVTPTFNRADLITRALDSVRTQTSPPARIIIVDDASTDGTPDIVRRWAAHHNFPVTVESLTCNGGPAMARNRGIELSTTEYVAFLDSDDEHLPGTLKRLVTPLDALPEAALSFADATIVTPTTREPHGLFRPRIKLNTEAEPLQFPGLDIRALIDATSTLLKASIIPTSATCFRRKAALAAGPQISVLAKTGFSGCDYQNKVGSCSSSTTLHYIIVTTATSLMPAQPSSWRGKSFAASSPLRAAQSASSSLPNNGYAWRP